LSQVPQSCCADQRCPSPLARCSGPLGPDAAARASLAAPGRLGPDTSAHASLAAAPGPLGPDAAARASLAALWDPTPLHTPRSLLLALWDPTLLRTPRSLLLALWDPTPRPPGAHPANLHPCPNAAPSRGSAAGRALLRRGTFLRRARRPGGPSDQPGRAAAAIAPTVRAGTQPRPSQPPAKPFRCPRPPHAGLCRAPAAFARPNANRATAAAGSHATPPPPTRSQNAYPASRPVHHRRRPTDPGEPTARYQAAIVCRPRGRTLRPGGPGATHAAARASLAASGPRGEGGGERVGKGGGSATTVNGFLDALRTKWRVRAQVPRDRGLTAKFQKGLPMSWDPSNAHLDNASSNGPY
jgi:hypothetical protein